MTFTAIITPFKEDQSIDWESFEKLLKLQFNSIIDGLVVLGTTAETPTLSTAEQQAIVVRVLDLKKQIDSDKQIWVGVSDNSTSRVVNKIEEHNNNPQIAGYLIASPWYNKPGQDGLKAHFVEADKVSTKPIMLYNVPGRTGVYITPETTLEIIKSTKNVRHVKDATGSLDYLNILQNLLIQNGLGDQVIHLSGDDALTLAMLALGAVGSVSVISNLLPAELSSIAKNFNDNNIQEARKIHFELLDQMNQCFSKTNPISIKEMLFQKQIINSDQVRLPLVR